RVVVVDLRHRAQRIEIGGADVDRLTQHFKTGSSEKFARLLSVVACSIDRKRERLEPTRRLTFVQQQRVEAEQHGAAVYTAGKRDADWAAGSLDAQRER